VRLQKPVMLEIMGILVNREGLSIIDGRFDVEQHEGENIGDQPTLRKTIRRITPSDDRTRL
ncbi:MAG: hypothetical protein VW443_10765, partial [Pseudomonadales bacterium]